MADTSNIDWSDHKIAFACEGIEGKDVLDIGSAHHDPTTEAGPHWVHKAIRERAGSVIGLDLDPEDVGYLQGKGYDMVVGNAHGFDLGRKFDVIFAGDLIEHLENHEGFLESCKAHLKPGGEIRISTPNPWHWKFILRAALADEVPNNPDHTCWLCPRTLRQMAGRHGLELSGIRWGSRFLKDRLVPLPKRWRHTSWHAVLRPVA